MSFVGLLTELMRELRMSGEKPMSDARHFEIHLKDGPIVTLSLSPGDKQCSLSTLLCFFPTADKAGELFEILLAAHAFGVQTNGTFFGVDRESAKVFAFKLFDLDRIDVPTMIEELGLFTRYTKEWRGLVSSGSIYLAQRADAKGSQLHTDEAVIFR